MRQDLEDLWNYYLIEVPIKNTKKEDILVKKYSNSESKFRSKLTDDQCLFLEEYNDANAELSRISERHAFIKGVMFATRFIFQAMYDD
ncbi:MAG: hypothetical protein IKU41_04245 [Clostridia bacterium]|nr:hypothetical protein [Clostridia bacterium]